MPDDTEQWALIFNTLGKETTREMLFDIAASLHDAEENDRRVIEVRAGTDTRVLEITDYIDRLESQLEAEYGSYASPRNTETTDIA